MDIFSYTFFQNALVGLLLVSVASAIVGTYVVARRMVFITGGITHASFGGLGLAFWAGVNPVLGAAVAAVAAALGVEWLTGRGHVREDSAIGVVWALGMALGTVAVFATPGYVPELNSFLFGNVLAIGAPDLWAFAALLAVLVAVLAVWYRPIVACAFDPDFARTLGLPVARTNMVMTILVSLTVVLTARLAGIMMLMSLLTLPPLVAERHTSRMLPMMAWAVGVNLVCSLGGLLLSSVTAVPVSATIVLLLVAAYALSALWSRLARRA